MLAGVPALGYALMVPVNACHAAAGKVRVPPSRLVVSRTITPAAAATSTHAPPPPDE